MANKSNHICNFINDRSIPGVIFFNKKSEILIIGYGSNNSKLQKLKYKIQMFRVYDSKMSESTSKKYMCYGCCLKDVPNEGDFCSKKCNDEYRKGCMEYLITIGRHSFIGL